MVSLKSLKFSADPSLNPPDLRYKVLSWNSRWRRSLTKYACNHIILYMAQLIGSYCISSQWAWNTWSAFAVVVAARFQKPSTFPSSTCIDLLWVIHVCYIVQQQRVFLTHSSMLCMYCMYSSNNIVNTKPKLYIQ